MVAISVVGRLLLDGAMYICLDRSLIKVEEKLTVRHNSTALLIGALDARDLYSQERMRVTISTRLFTLFKGKLVGIDSYGNRYYRGPTRFSGGHERRWVLYKGIPEASKVPPGWHAWLHHTVNSTPPLVTIRLRSWQKEHLPNLTGTPNCYLPPGHENHHGGQCDPATGGYEPWHPE